jgi:WD40 repeat protein
MARSLRILSWFYDATTKDETHILSWSDDRTVRLRDAVTGSPIGPAMKHDGSVNGALLTKDETRILSRGFYDATRSLRGTSPYSC